MGNLQAAESKMAGLAGRGTIVVDVPYPSFTVKSLMSWKM